MTGSERAAWSSSTASRASRQRYCVWLSKANYTYRVALHSSHLVIHFLSADDLPLAELFGTQTGDTVDKFAGLPVDSGPAARRCSGSVPIGWRCAA